MSAGTPASGLEDEERWECLCLFGSSVLVSETGSEAPAGTGASFGDVHGDRAVGIAATAAAGGNSKRISSSHNEQLN